MPAATAFPVTTSFTDSDGSADPEAVIQRAIDNGETIWIRYQKPNERPLWRFIKPYSIGRYTSYVLSVDLLKDGVYRNFSLPRILDVRTSAVGLLASLEVNAPDE